MKKTIVAVLVAVFSVACLGISAWGAGSVIKEGDLVTICNAGPDCGKFEVVVKDPAECKCGAQAEQMHVLKVVGEVAVLCQCGGKCACSLSKKNPYLCGCGTPVKTVRILK